jgi:Tfp pilus assembly protein FimT
VVAIMMIMTLVSVPYLVKSIRGNRLRTAAGTVAMAGRYARSMALLHQREVTLSFDIDQGIIHVQSRYEPTPPPESAAGSLAETNGTRGTGESSTNGETTVGFSPDGQKIELTRVLDGVRIDYVEINEKERQSEGTAVIYYRTNGRCTPYRVRVEDEQRNGIVTIVDALASARSEREDK